MNNTEKSILIAGMTFNVIFFLLMLVELVITKAAGYALLLSIMTYLFFEYGFYAQKKTETHSHE
ncbi:hypothetical protein [Staphylococcus caledonicus]|uniref:hypothetical protein n=1 Tax=Staphylococcus caledonicus TaxID=2741333 RepID=UPI0018E44723|nr:hypothetical protein [Staphylococcus caledonicus]MBI5972187.1 hypothetical protein [Staphylococcus caledonicus]